MERPPDSIAAGARRVGVVALAAVALAVVMTWPLGSAPGRLGRTSSDGLHSIWNVSWVAHALVADPAGLFDANIFAPHRRTLAYSEANIGAGLVAVPAWWLTRNPFAAHNSALIFAFASAFVGMWLLARRLWRDSTSAAIAALLFAFCPYLFSHTPHIQLLMIGGIPFAMLALHRLADQPSRRRGVVLGLALAAQTLSCAYYGIFAGLMVGYAVLFLAVSRGLWRNRTYWTSVGLGAVVLVACVLPFFLPYLDIQQDEGFRRTLADSIRYSARPASYIASSAHAHRWMLPIARAWGGWNGEVLFPGFLAVGLGAAGVFYGLRGGAVSRDRETVALYGSLGLLAFWASFGPAAGMYTVLFRAIPLFTFLRAPSRFGLLVTFVLVVLAALALRRLLASLRGRQRQMAAAGIGLLALAELNLVPFPWDRAPAPSAAYALLARMPRATVAEFPFYGERVAFPLHTQYMLFSTAHWMPMVNGYSDHIPTDFRKAAPVLDSFPSRESFAVMQRYRVRYIGVHWDMYVSRAAEIRERLVPYARYLRPLASDASMTLYEIVSYP